MRRVARASPARNRSGKKAGAGSGRAARPTSGVRRKPGTVEEYLANLSHDKRAALERLRKIIRAAAPGVEERISYQIPGFRLDGKWIVWIGAAENHCAMYGVVGGFENELKGYDTSGRGTIRFRPGNPLPTALVRKLVKARMARTKLRKRPSARGSGQ